MADPRVDGLARLVDEREGHDWCLFLDRDGVINRRRDGDYVRSVDDLRLLPGAVDALVALSWWAPRIVVVTNQQGVGKGLYSAGDLALVHGHLLDVVLAAGGRIDDVLVCPHLVADRCACRKPADGLAAGWLAERPYVDASLSVMVGDSPSDLAMAAALAARTGGCAAVRIDGRRRWRHDDLTYPSLAALAARVQSAQIRFTQIRSTPKGLTA